MVQKRITSIIQKVKFTAKNGFTIISFELPVTSFQKSFQFSFQMITSTKRRDETDPLNSGKSAD